MFLKPTTNAKYAEKIDGKPNPNHEPDRINLQVFDPALKNFLPPEGREVGGETPYWTRRINAGEVKVLTDAEAALSLEQAETVRKAAKEKADKEKSDADAAAKIALEKSAGPDAKSLEPAPKAPAAK